MAKKKNYVGEKNISHCGLEMEIIAYRSSKDLDVRFENGMVRTHCAYHNFKNGKIAPSSTFKGMKSLGRKNRNQNGMMMEIVGYRNKSDIDVRFEDGAIAEHCTMRSFTKGCLSYPKASKIGEKMVNSNKQTMEIIAYRTADDVDVRFEDGTVIKHREYRQFKRGKIINYAARIGEESIAHNGMRMKIIAYRKTSDIDVEFEDGTVVRNKSYDNFKKGIISIPRNKVGETTRCKNGLIAEIIAYRSSADIDVKYSDGTINTHRTYYDFRHGINPKKPDFKDPTGTIITTNSGIRVKLIAYRRRRDADVQFEDGTIKEHIDTTSFMDKSFGLPLEDGLFHGVHVLRGFKKGDKTYYKCTFANGDRDILTPQEIMERRGIEPAF